MEEKVWTNEDEDCILSHLNKKRELEVIAILETYKETPRTIKAIEYPISLDSKIFLLGLDKSREKESSFLFEYVGDWCYQGKVSRDEKEEIKRITNREITFLE